MKHPDSRPDPLIEALVRRAREEDRMADPRWDALSAGELSPAAAEELRRLAAEGKDAPGDAYEMLRPFDEEERDALADGIFAALDRKREAAASVALAMPNVSVAPSEPVVPSVPVVPSEPVVPSVPVASSVPVVPSVPVASSVPAGPAPVIPFPKRGRTLIYAATAVLSLAAGAVLFLRFQGSGVETLPVYTAVVEGGRSDQRAFPGPSAAPTGRAPARLSAGGRVDITLRPATTAGGELTVRAFLVDSNTARPWNAPVEPRPNGSFRVAGIERRMLPEPIVGAAELVFVIGRPGALPSDAEIARLLVARAPFEPEGAAQVVAIPLTLDETR